MGPFQMNDLVGLDLGWRARKLNGIKPEDVPITARVADKLCEMDRYGQKTSRGYYIYPEGSRAGTADPEVVQIVEETSAELGIERRPIDDDEVLKRCLYPMINEGARILEDGIAIRPCDIDIVYINGYGFPEVTGGPMFWADKLVSIISWRTSRNSKLNMAETSGNDATAREIGRRGQELRQPAGLSQRVGRLKLCQKQRISALKAFTMFPSM